VEERGQGTVEWVALLLVVVVALAAGAAVAVAGPAAGLARAVRCAVLAGCHGEDAELQAAYGSDVAGMVRAFAPGFDYEPRTLTLPVDFRSCRAHRCADAPDRRGADVWRSTRGRQATVFTHVVDRRPAGGDLFIQYWLYYPDSTWSGPLYAASRLPVVGHMAVGLLAGAVSGHHGDDWESYQVRVTRSGEVLARSSAHNGYAGRHHWPNLNELPVEVPVPGLRTDLPVGRHLAVSLRERTGAWVLPTGWTHVSRGSHAGFLPAGPGGDRRTGSNGVRLVPIERLSAAALATRFAIVPPWRKPVYADPERTDT
jgi:hypothetical protein